MKRLAGMAAVLLMTAAHSETQTADVNVAIGYVKDAWNDFSHCRRPSACNTFFDSFGVALPFADGSIAPFAHAQRLTATSRDCIKTARSYLDQGDRSLAVQWAMAARIENTRVRDWMGSHPDAVLEALRRCCW